MGGGGEGPKPMTRFSSSTTKAGSGVAKILKEGGGIISTFLVKHIFFSRTNLKLIKKQEKLLGVRGMLPQEILRIYMLQQLF